MSWHCGNTNVHVFSAIGNDERSMASSNFARCRFVEVDDYRWFFKTIDRTMEEELGAKYSSMVPKEDWFVDFLR